MAKSVREWVESPREIGEDETVPYTLTVPTTWGVPSSPTGVVKDSNGDAVASAISAGPTVSGQVISFTIDASGSAMAKHNDYRCEILFDVVGGSLEAWGTLQCKE